MYLSGGKPGMKKRVVLEKSGGRNLPLYAEVGKFFSPDGILDEVIFKTFLTEKLKNFREKFDSEDNFVEAATGWIYNYISQLLDYLNDKGLFRASALILKITAREASRFGIKKITVSPEYLGDILSDIGGGIANREDRKDSIAEKRNRIFDAAIKVFAREGFHGATIDKIASASGMGKGSIYRYFKSKEDLLEELLKAKFADIVNRINKICSTDSNVLEQAREMIESWISFIQANHLLYRLIQSEMIFRRSGRQIFFYDYFISRLPLFKERIVSLNRDKKLKTTSFYTVCYGILGFIDGVVHKWYRCDMDYPLTDEIPVILEVLFNGFVGESTTRQRFFVPSEEKETP